MMGVVNTNPDSFYSHRANDKESLQQLIHKMVQQGADIVDIGAESTSPYSQPITYEEEIHRLKKTLIPVLAEGNWPQGVALSLDSYHLETVYFMAEWLEMNHAEIPFLWNDIAGEHEEEVVALLRRFPKMDYIFCHNWATPRNMAPRHMSFARSELSGEELLSLMYSFFSDALNFFERHQLLSRVILDPAFAFGKSREQNHYLCQHFVEWVNLFSHEQRWLIGISRKSFLRPLSELKSQDPALLLSLDQIQSSLLTHWLHSLPHHSFIIRVHDPLVVKSTISCLNILLYP